MQVDVAGADNRVELSDAVFGQVFNEALVHQAVTAVQAGARSGTKKQKNRSEVRGGGKKPWRQKGTGRARAGTIRSPIWAGGGVTFAARPRGFVQKVNRRMYRGALRCILSELLRLERLKVVADIELSTRKTRSFIEAMAERQAADADVVVVSALDDNLAYSARNIPGVRVVAVSAVDPVILAGASTVAITESARSAIEGWLS